MPLGADLGPGDNYAIFELIVYQPLPGGRGATAKGAHRCECAQFTNGRFRIAVVGISARLY
jgi:hypothetical protein